MKRIEVMFAKLTDYLAPPKLYTLSSSPFWDDEHISKAMLAALLQRRQPLGTRLCQGKCLCAVAKKGGNV